MSVSSIYSIQNSLIMQMFFSNDLCKRISPLSRIKSRLALNITQMPLEVICGAAMIFCFATVDLYDWRTKIPSSSDKTLRSPLKTILSDITDITDQIDHDMSQLVQHQLKCISRRFCILKKHPRVR